jgi:hypothetical protein
LLVVEGGVQLGQCEDDLVAVGGFH